MAVRIVRVDDEGDLCCASPGRDTGEVRDPGPVRGLVDEDAIDTVRGPPSGLILDSDDGPLPAGGADDASSRVRRSTGTSVNSEW